MALQLASLFSFARSSFTETKRSRRQKYQRWPDEEEKYESHFSTSFVLWCTLTNCKLITTRSVPFVTFYREKKAKKKKKRRKEIWINEKNIEPTWWSLYKTGFLLRTWSVPNWTLSCASASLHKSYRVFQPCTFSSGRYLTIGNAASELGHTHTHTQQ